MANFVSYVKSAGGKSGSDANGETAFPGARARGKVAFLTKLTKTSKHAKLSCSRSDDFAALVAIGTARHTFLIFQCSGLPERTMSVMFVRVAVG